MKKFYFVLVSILVFLMTNVNCFAESGKLFGSDDQNNSGLVSWLSESSENIKGWWQKETPQVMNWFSDRGSDIADWCQENGPIAWDWMKQTGEDAFEWGKQASLDLKDCASKRGENAKTWVVDNAPLLKEIAITLGTEMLMDYLEEAYPDEMNIVTPFIETTNGNLFADFLSSL